MRGDALFSACANISVLCAVRAVNSTASSCNEVRGNVSFYSHVKLAARVFRNEYAFCRLEELGRRHTRDIVAFAKCIFRKYFRGATKYERGSRLSKITETFISSELHEEYGRVYSSYFNFNISHPRDLGFIMIKLRTA